MSRETPDEAALRVIGYSRRSARIVRPWSAVTDTPSSGEGVPIVLPGSPGVELVLDHDYWAVAVKGPDRWPSVSWVLGSKDEQSGLDIDVSDPMPLSALLDDASGSRGPRPPRQTSKVGGQEVEWSRWSDYGELYSGCTVGLLGYDVRLRVTAKTEARRQALEEHLASLRLTSSPPPSRGGPKN
ncbi:MAG TPA: hypothetical protein VKZ18_14295 [Polyangia bacterium]|nr:hypothetical protein [Polyangia bacterium]